MIRGTIISSVTDSYLKLGYHYWWPRKAGMFVKGCEGRGEYRLGDICFTHCPGSAGPPGASERQTTLKKSGMQVPSDHLGLTCSRQFAVCNWMGIYWNRFRLGTEAKLKEFRGKFLSWLNTWNFQACGPDSQRCISSPKERRGSPPMVLAVWAGKIKLLINRVTHLESFDLWELDLRHDSPKLTWWIVKFTKCFRYISITTVCNLYLNSHCEKSSSVVICCL